MLVHQPLADLLDMQLSCPCTMFALELLPESEPFVNENLRLTIGAQLAEHAEQVAQFGDNVDFDIVCLWNCLQKHVFFYASG